MNTTTEISKETDFLFARPSFTSGFISITDWANALNTYNNSSSPTEADAKAMNADWASVFNDLALAIKSDKETMR